MDNILEQPLTDENKQKVCLIRDINAVHKAIHGKDIDVRKFNELYDSSITVLDTTYLNIRHQYNCRAVVL